MSHDNDTLELSDSWEPVTRSAAPDTDAVLLGEGGMGRVWRVYDEELRRNIAVKMLHPGLVNSAAAKQRFLAEAQLTAQLDHPGVVPVYAVGVDANGQPWFSMREVKGQTLAHAAPTMTPLAHLDVLRRVCEAVASAHDRGVIHRDLKPQNIMVGRFGEVVVLDWGIAQDRDSSLDTVRQDLALAGGALTQAGHVPGTPGYLAPERLNGEPASTRSDVYALGCMLEHIPLDLAGLVEACRARNPEDRPADAGEVAEALAEWITGDQQRERAHQLIHQAQERRPEVQRLRQRADGLAEQVAEHLRTTAPGGPLADKRQQWAREDHVATLRRSAAVLDIDIEASLRGALSHAPMDALVNGALVEHHMDRLLAADRQGRRDEIMREEALVRRHLTHVPADDPLGQRARDWLRGEGRLRLQLAGPTQVWISRLVERDRVQTPDSWRDLGTVEAVDLQLARGSYLVRLCAEDLATLHLPVFIEPLQVAELHAPGEAVPRILHLALPEHVAEDCLVPEGWFVAGGDAQAPQSPPRMRLWVERFAMMKNHVLNQDYLEFLNDLVARGEGAKAADCVPKPREDADPLWRQGADGRYVMCPDEEGDEWPPDWPVAVIPFDAAQTYARWFAAKTGLPWRLPTEWEWEKAARGVDGRSFPWGDYFDRDFFRSRSSHEAYPFPAAPDDHPQDTSIYGVRHMAGNFCDWCASTWHPVLGVKDGDRVDPVEVEPNHPMVMLRGGSWNGSLLHARAAARCSISKSNRAHVTSFRLVRSL